MSRLVIPLDKANHLLWGLFVFLIAAFAASGAGVALPGEFALVVTAWVGGSKEVIDHLLNLRAQRRGQPAPHSVDPWDGAATFGGGLLGYLATLL